MFVSDDNCTAVLVAKYCELAVRSQALLAHPLQQLHMEALCDELGALVALHSSPSHAGKDTDHRQKSATIPSPQSTLKPQHRKPLSQLQLWGEIFRLVSVVNGEECARLRKVIDRHLQRLAKLKGGTLNLFS